MNAECRDFRLLLERRLAGRAAPQRLAELAWHEHLFGCGECRALLDAEEALESLLASLPEPRLAPALRERVIARLRSSRLSEAANVASSDAGLDRLLEFVETGAPPPDLARHVLAGLAREAHVRGGDELDRLLELDVVDAPVGLSGRTLVALRLARRTPTRPITVWRIAAVAAAAAAIAAIAWLARPNGPARTSGTPEVVVEPASETRTPDVAPVDAARGGVRPQSVPETRVAAGATVPDEVLAALDVLENWDVLVAEDADELSTLPTPDEALIEALEGEG